jgi:hypothetical protein
MTWVMLIISLTTNQILATVPYQTRADCEREIPLVFQGNFFGTVRVVCRPSLEG